MPPGAADEALLVRQLSRLSGLTQLHLTQTFWPESQQQASLPHELVGALRHLPHLTSLTIQAQRALPSGVCDSVLALTHLAELSLAAPSLFQNTALTKLTSLSSLRQLALKEMSIDLFQQAVGADWQAEAVMPAVFGAPGLDSFEIYRTGDGILELPGGTLPELKYTCTETGGPGARTATLLLYHRRLHSLQHVLASILPPGVTLASLDLHSCFLDDVQAVQDCPALATLTSLKLPSSAFDGSPQREAVWSAVVRQAPHLKELHVKRAFSYMGDETGVLARLPIPHGLKRLFLTDCSLTDLPAAPWLADLEELDCSDNSFKQVPRALVCATALHRLALSNSVQPDCTYNDDLNLELTAADVDDVLARLPALRTLQLGYTRLPPAVVAHLRAAAPLLEVSHVPLPPEYRSDAVIRRKIQQQESRSALLDRWLDARRAVGLPEWQGWRDMPLMDYELEADIEMMETPGYEPEDWELDE